MPKITKRFVETIKPDFVKSVIYWDTELKGFGVVILPSGRQTYCIQYRNSDRVQKRLKIGVHGHITTEEARALARKRLGSVAHGEDPVEKKRQTQALFTIHDLARDYIERHGQKKRAKSLLEDQKLLKNIILPILGHLKVENLSRREIENLHFSLEKTPYQANRVLSLLSKMFSLAVSWGWRADNPAIGIEKYQEEKRDRWLNDAELQRIWAVLDQYPQHSTSYVFKFLILTGARKSEVLKATWDQFDFEKGIWTKPSHLTKQKKQAHLPLSDKALEVLESIKKLNIQDSRYLFPGRVKDD